MASRRKATKPMLMTFRSTHIGSADVWYFPAAEEDAAHQDHENVVQKVKKLT